MVLRYSRYFFLYLFLFLYSCLNDKYNGNPFEASGYPDDVAEIMVTKCAVSGCHNTQSAQGAAGLDLSTWDRMFDGSRGGTAVIPYRSDQSFIINFINTYDDIDSNQASPLMPLDKEPLSREEVMTIKNWIDAGAPDRNGFVKFSDNPQRKKFYVTNQACDEISVFDAEKKVTMRMIHVGSSPAVESPHMIRASADGKYWYMILLANSFFYKFRAFDDSLVAQLNLDGYTGWNTFNISQDSKTGVVAQWASNGAIAFVDLETMTKKSLFIGFNNPHGCEFNQAGDTAYVLASFSNFIYKIPVNDPTGYEEKYISLGITRPHDIVFAPDHSKYFVTCEATSELRVMNASNDLVITTLPTGAFPQEVVISALYPYLFVTNMQGHSVSVINYNTLSVEKTISVGYNPHGLAVDDAAGLVYVVNRNVDPNGPPPHHTGACGGRNGYLTIIDMNTLELVPGYKHELLPDPYFVTLRK